MARGKGEGSIRFDPKRQLWVAQVDLGRDPSTGKRQRPAFYGQTRAEAREKLTAAIKAKDERNYVKPTKETVAEFLTRWLRDYVQNAVAETTFGSYADEVKNHIIPHLGSLKLRDLRTPHVQTWIRTLLEQGRKDGKGGLSTRTVRYACTIFHAALDQAVEEGLIPRNPADAARQPKLVQKEIKPFTPDQEETFLMAALEDRRFRAFWILLLATGMRRGEALGLRWEDVDMHKSLVYVRQQVVSDHGKVLIKDVKTKAARRMITVPDLVISAVRGHKIIENETWPEREALRQDHPLVFSNYDGSPRDPRAVARRFERLLKRLGFVDELGRPTHSIHDLRHTHATRLLEANVHPKVVSERLGHANISVTLNTYSHVLPGLQAQLASQIEEAVLPASLKVVKDPGANGNKMATLGLVGGERETDAKSGKADS